MSVVLINGTTYNEVEVHFNNDDPRSITFILPKGDLDLDEVAADFSAADNHITIDDVVYTGYVMFKSLAYDLNQVVILLAQRSVQEQLDEGQTEIAELQDAVAEILEIIGG